MEAEASGVRAYEQSLLGTERIDTPPLLATLKSVKDAMRHGIGSRSKILFCNPALQDQLNAIVKAATTSCADLHMAFPYRVITSPSVPKYGKRKMVKFFKDKFCDHSQKSPDSPLTDEEYLQMCTYFGWAGEVEVDYPVWFELDENSFDQWLNTASMLRNRKDYGQSLNKRVFQVFMDNPKFNLQPSNRCLL